VLNIRALLGDLGVPFWTSGKNVSAGWTSIQCPLCTDRSNHGGFSPNGKGYSCFICGNHSVAKVINQYTNSYTKTKKLFKEYSDTFSFVEDYDKERAANLEWPPVCSKHTFPSIHAEYLHKRGFDPKQVRELYDVKACYYTGFMKYRLVIPIFQNGTVVSYVGRDVTDKAVLRYKNLPDKESILSVKETIYNIDAVHEIAIITEGIFDCWRFGVHGVCTFGLTFTNRQIRVLTSKIKTAVICFDNEPQAQEKAKELAEALSLQGIVTYILSIKEKDPGMLTQRKADKIKAMVLNSLT
jgi:DNA primase